MASITRDVRIDVQPDKVLEALTAQRGYAAWWTRSSEVGASEAEFGFDGGKMKVRFRFDEKSPDRVRMTCVSQHDNPEWQDTTLLFELRGSGNATDLHFVHDGWRKAGTDVYNQCVGGWEFFLSSLKSYLETGAGTPNAG